LAPLRQRIMLEAKRKKERERAHRGAGGRLARIGAGGAGHSAAPADSLRHSNAIGTRRAQ